MPTKKSVVILIALVFFSLTILTACNDTSKSNTSTDTTTVQAAPSDSSAMGTMQDTSMMMDTSKMDTASTRPIRHPN